MSWWEIVAAVIVGVGAWFAAIVGVGVLLGPLLAKRAQQEMQRRMLGALMRPQQATTSSSYVAPTVTTGDLQAAGLVDAPDEKG